MKKLALILIFIFTAFSTLSAKKFVKKWIIIKDTENKIVYIDTSSIRKTDGQLSLWSLVQYKQPKEFVMYQGKVSKVKAHILFDTERKRYTVIGALYFDKRARIIGESSTPAISGNQKIISSPIIADSDQQILLDKANEYIATGKVVKEVPKNILDEKPKKFIVHKYSEPEKVVKDTIVNPFGDVPSEPVLTADSTIIGNSIGNELRGELIKPENEDTTAATADTVVESKDESVADSIGNFIGKQLKNSLKTDEDSSTSNYFPSKSVGQKNDYQKEILKPGIDSSNDIASNIKSKIQDETANIDGTNKPDQTSYNPNVEEQVSKNIWSDGNLFVIQLSSWRSKSKAESIVKKLISKGHLAFVFSKYISNKKRKYYRVRIGYFTSLTEAKSYFKTMK